MGHNPYAAAPPPSGKGKPGTSRLVSGPLVIGIDPGLSGALAFLPEAPNLPWVEDMPVVAHGQGFVKRAVDLPELARSLKLLTVIGEPRAFMERVSAFPGQGVGSMFSLGMSFWGVAGVLAALGIPLQLVEPKAWKGHFGLEKDKELARRLAMRYYPSVKLDRKKDHNRAEALLIARFGLERK